MEGYKLWKEGYVSNTKVKPNVKACGSKLFLVKANVAASMKSIRYSVNVRLDMESSSVVHANCSCKAGKGGCCKHVAALLYTIVDFSNLKLHYVPEEVTCTQVLQKWSVPTRKITSQVAVKFSDLEFEKADFEKDKNKKRKRPFVTGNREGFCATQSYARKVKSEEIELFASALENAGKASHFVNILKGNSYIPCNKFVTSCTIAEKEPQVQETIASETGFNAECIFSFLPKNIDATQFGAEALQKVTEAVGVTMKQALIIEESTRKQSNSQIWHFERSKRITSSMFGRVMKRKEQIYPKSIFGHHQQLKSCKRSQISIFALGK